MVKNIICKLKRSWKNSHFTSTNLSYIVPYYIEREKTRLMFMMNMANLISARDLLRESLEKSREIDIAIQENTEKMDSTRKRLELMKGGFEDLAWKCTLFKVGSQVDGALGPADSIFRIFLVIQELQASSLSTSLEECDDLCKYFANLRRIEDAERLLKDNSQLVMLWLQDALQFLNSPPDNNHWYVLVLKRAMKILQEIQGKTNGFFAEAFDQMEAEFRRILMDDSFSPSFMDSDSEMALISASSPLFSVSDMNKMHAIMERFQDSDLLQRLASVFVEVRTSNVRTSLQCLDVHYLQLSLSESDSVQILEPYIDQWGTHLHFAVKYLFEIEYRLCHDVFQDKKHDDIRMECFAAIVVDSGFYDFIKFGHAIARAKKEAVKLFMLLNIFSALNKLRLDFNKLFAGKSCRNIQTRTRNLLEKIINGACEIFWDLSVQVEEQRSSAAPLDGRVPRLVRFVTDFCTVLLQDDEYQTTLVDVLKIHSCWNGLKFNEAVFSDQIRLIVRALELNLQAWSEGYSDSILSCFFRMNNYWHFCQKMKPTTKLGVLMGEKWILTYKEDFEHYLAVFIKESWGKLVSFLREDGLILFPGGRAFDRKLVRRRLEEFNSAFEEMYTKQICWVLSDKALRLQTRYLIVQAVIPSYESYLQKYTPNYEDEDKSVKYSSTSLKDMINFLFQPKLGKHGSKH